MHTKIKKYLSHFKNNLINFPRKSRDYYKDTHVNYDVQLISEKCIEISDLDLSMIRIDVAEYLSNMYLNHRFDLLGSGWVKNSYNSEANGFEGYSFNVNLNIEKFDVTGNWLTFILLRRHLNKSKEIWRNISPGYIPIDWQKDFKSGFRWSAKSWHKDQRKKSMIGADLKVPWELARLQHLPQMAFFALKLTHFKKQLIEEFKNQLIDFIATNPPRMGVNWVNTMEVGIRAANILVAYDLFNQIDEYGILNSRFKQIFSNSIYEHGLFIVNHLDFNRKLTSNHYLANIAGLLFISSYLSLNNRNDVWLSFAVQELIKEMHKQFYEDGGNFESSTSYHRLSLEMILFSTSLLLGLNPEKKQILVNYDLSNWNRKPGLKNYNSQDYKCSDIIRLPDSFVRRIYRAIMFSYHLTKPTNEVPQIGDNDSGRFFRFSPNGALLSTQDAIVRYKNLSDYNYTDKLYWDENILNQSTLLSTASGLFSDERLVKFSFDFPLEQSIVRSLAKKNVITIEKDEYSSVKNKKYNLTNLNYRKQTILQPKLTKKLTITDSLDYYLYPKSQVYLFKSKRLYLLISAMPNGQNGNGGHCHNDKLSFELSFDDEDLIVDPGTYVYTPLPVLRNKFRSVKVHNTLIVNGIEQNDWINNKLFKTKDEAKCELLDIDKNSITLGLNYRNISQIRKFQILNNKIIIDDFSNVKFSVNFNYFNLYSNGYGKLLNKIIPEGSGYNCK